MSSTLWTTPVQGSGKIIRAAAALGGVVSLELPAAYEHYIDNKKPEFLSKFPHGKIPALEEADGFKVFESVPVARYVSGLAPKSNLLGKTLEESALISDGGKTSPFRRARFRQVAIATWRMGLTKTGWRLMAKY